MDTKRINEPFELDLYFRDYWKYFDEGQAEAVRALVENAHQIGIALDEDGNTRFQISIFSDKVPASMTRALYRLRKQFFFTKAFSLEIEPAGFNNALLTAVIPTNEIRNPLQFIAKWAIRYKNRQFQI